MSASLHPVILIAAMIAALIAVWCWIAERGRRQREATDHAARLAAAFRALRECQAANDYLAGEVRKREAAIGRLLAQQNAATVAKAAANQRNIGACFALGLPVHRVDLRQINWN